jgi:hypothetical protein
MKVKELVWIGTRTEKFGEMLEFCKNVMGFNPAFVEPGFAALDMPNGDRFEIFGADSPYNTFYTHPVVGFLPRVVNWRAHTMLRLPASSRIPSRWQKAYWQAPMWASAP